MRVGGGGGMVRQIVSGDPWIMLDGRLNASAGVAPQHPTALLGYATRPPWQVAGVDYGVGIPPSVTLTGADVFSLPSGVTRNAGAHQITITGDDVLLSAVDFSVGGGWQLIVQGFRPTLRYLRFKVGANALEPIELQGTFDNAAFGSDSDISYCEFDGNGVDTGGGFTINYKRAGTHSFTYSVIKNNAVDAFKLGVNGSNGETASYVQKYNLFENNGTTTNAANHNDWMQPFSGTPTLTYGTWTHQFNFTYQVDVGVGGQGTAGFQWEATTGGQAIFGNASITNNTLVTAVAGVIGNCFIHSRDQTNGTIRYTSNYCDPTGLPVLSTDFAKNFSNAGAQSGTTVASGNINMLDGSQPNGWNAGMN